MRKVFFFFVIYLLFCTTAQADTTLMGTGIPDTDLNALQEALDKGGVVTLKGTFDVGPLGRIIIKNDVTVQGETDSIGMPTTVIRGGYRTFHCPLPVAKTPPSKPGPVVVFKNLHFVNAKGTPLHFPHAGGITLRNLTVEKMRPERVAVRWKDSDSIGFVAGVVVGTELAYNAPVRNAVQGNVLIQGCRFYAGVERPLSTSSRGILVSWTTGASIVIRDNIIRNASRAGISVLDNSRTPSGQGNILIESNNVLTADAGIEYPNRFTPNGIVAGWFHDTSGGVNIQRFTPLTITRNRVEVRGETSIGILIFEDDAVVACNDITMGGGEGAIGIAQTGSRGFLTNNRIQGEGKFALQCIHFEALKGSGNVLAWNGMEDFKPIRGHIMLTGAVNTIIGKAGIVTDRAKGTRILDISPCPLPGAEADDWEPVAE